MRNGHYKVLRLRPHLAGVVKKPSPCFESLLGGGISCIKLLRSYSPSPRKLHLDPYLQTRTGIPWHIPTWMSRRLMLSNLNKTHLFPTGKCIGIQTLTRPPAQILGPALCPRPRGLLEGAGARGGARPVFGRRKPGQRPWTQQQLVGCSHRQQLVDSKTPKMAKDGNLSSEALSFETLALASG